MRSFTVSFAIAALLLGCAAEDPAEESSQGGETPQGAGLEEGESGPVESLPLDTASGIGGGVVFLDSETAVHIRLLVGSGESYHQVDVTYEGDISGQVLLPRLSSAFAYLTRIDGGDGATEYELLENASQITFSLDREASEMQGELVVEGLPPDSSTPVLISGPFRIPVGPSGAPRWTCDFGSVVKDCEFLK